MATLSSFVSHAKANMARNIAESEWMAAIWLLLEDATGFTKKDLVLHPNILIPEFAEQKLWQKFERLIAGEPVQYILGYSYFRYIKLKVGPEVLIPRQETEWLVGLILDKVQGIEVRGIDACTGSGCIALSLAYERPAWNVEAFDFSPQALELANQNQASLGTHVHFYHADALHLQVNYEANSLDFIVSNPPYVPIWNADEVADNVKRFEPSMAVFVEHDDPIVFYKRLFQYFLPFLKPGGWLFFEIHPNSETLLNDYILSFSGIRHRFEKDFKNLTRFLLIEKQPL